MKLSLFKNMHALVCISMMSFLFLSGTAYSASPPVFNEVEIPVAQQDIFYSYDLNLLVADADNDVLTFVVSNLPSWLTLSGSVLSGTPTSNDGPCNCTLNVSASDNETPVTKGFDFLVYPVNTKDSYEPDNTRSEASPVVVTNEKNPSNIQKHTLDNKDDVDWFVLYSLDERRHTVQVRKSRGDIVISVYRADGTLLLEEDSSFSDKRMNVNLEKGLYYFSVKPSANTFTEEIAYDFYITNDELPVRSVVFIRLIDEDQETITSITSGEVEILSGGRVQGVGIVASPGFILAQSRRANSPVAVFNSDGYEELIVDLPSIRQGQLIEVDVTMSNKIFVADTTPPIFQTLTDIVKEATGALTAVSLPTVTATDDGNTLQATVSNTGPFSVGTTTITWTATDSSDNSATVTQDIIIRDTTKPSFSTLTDITAYAEVGKATVDFPSATATDIVDGTITATTNFVKGEYAAGTYVITWTATDTAGNTATTTQNVIVSNDETKPAFDSSVLADISVEATAKLTPVTLPTVTATDDGNTLQATASNTGPFAVGTTTITWTATDTAGNTETNTQKVIVTDTTKPSFGNLVDIAIFAATGDGAVDFSAASATDIVDGTITATTNFVKGDYAAGTYVITWTATDTAGNTATTTQNVIVSNDETKPAFDNSVLADISVEATAKLTPVTLLTVTATDDGNTLQATASNTGPFAVGTTTITWTATDTAGNAETNTQKVIVADTTKPSFATLVDIAVFAATGDAAVDFSAASATDIVDGTVTATTNFVKGDYAAGTYVITWTATDTAGNSATATQNIIVSNDDTKPVFDVTALADITQEATATLTPVSLASVTATDDGNTLQATANNTGPFALGDTTITWTASDTGGNTASLTQVVRIVDTTAPVFAEIDRIEIDAQGRFTDISSLLNITAFDLVDGDIDSVISGETVFESGLHQVEVTATDLSDVSVTKTVEIAITPIVKLSQGMTVFAGTTATVDVALIGEALTYPVLVDYTVTDGDIVLVQEQLEITSGQSATIEFMVDANALAGTQREVTITGAQNAVLKDATTSLVSIVAVNVASIATINVVQQGITTGIVALDGGDITLTAQVSDVGPTTGYAYSWEETTLGNLGSDASVTLSAELLSAGPASIRLTVEELDTADLFSVIASKNVVVIDTLTLTSEVDSDGDGMSDAMEGAGDSDDDGIADYLDTDTSANVLPINDGTSVILAPVGIKLSLGSVAIAAGN